MSTIVMLNQLEQSMALMKAHIKKLEGRINKLERNKNIQNDNENEDDATQSNLNERNIPSSRCNNSRGSRASKKNNAHAAHNTLSVKRANAVEWLNNHMQSPSYFDYDLYLARHFEVTEDDVDMLHEVSYMTMFEVIVNRQNFHDAPFLVFTSIPNMIYGWDGAANEENGAWVVLAPKIVQSMLSRMKQTIYCVVYAVYKKNEDRRRSSEEMDTKFDKFLMKSIINVEGSYLQEMRKVFFQSLQWDWESEVAARKKH